ncbi:MAG: seryl-tRNA synthetase [Candidatus Berkelbacteria bacterium Licking1014_96]|uniref:Serine--tRNA ligase n=1 Tax=Candidatus Berkelbacteria bacterium Licking1014_96 TaxID=2017149 RepID=A0A554LD54_9BACT|nr:MAG: seryl-tRNA synthetase [Candidatus Berkelbacteria bacterium Licking1014_96]
MLDIKFIRENLKKVEEGAKNKGYKVDFKKLIDLDDRRKELIQKIDGLRAEQKKIDQSQKEKGRELKEKIKKIEPELAKIEKNYQDLMFKVPNLPAKDVKVGRDEKENEVVKTVGKIRMKEGKDHLILGRALDLIDTEASAISSGSRFAYLKNQAVMLEFALINFVFDLLTKEGFTPIIPPVLLKNEVARETGYYEAGNDDSFYLRDVPLVLVGTSEHSVLAYHKNKVLAGSELPKRYAAFSTCFRREAGSYGKDVKGILRVHQFDKVEMVSFCQPEKSEKELEYLLSLEEKIMQNLAIPYQVVKMCTGDLGLPAAKKYDLEAWLPGQKRFRETHSTSNCTDFQARRLNIKYKAKEGNQYLHTLNGTAVAIGRMIIAILENYQQEDGSVVIPQVLQRYCGFKKIAS